MLILCFRRAYCDFIASLIHIVLSIPLLASVSGLSSTVACVVTVLFCEVALRLVIAGSTAGSSGGVNFCKRFLKFILFQTGDPNK